MKRIADFLSSCFGAGCVLASLIGVAMSTSVLGDPPLPPNNHGCSPPAVKCQYCLYYDDEGCYQYGCKIVNCYFNAGINCFCTDSKPGYSCGCFL